MTDLFDRFRKLLSIFYFIGFTLHALDVLGLRLNFLELDFIWKSWIIFLLVFDLAASIGLFLKKWWGDVIFIIIALSQLIAYLKFYDQFGRQEFLIFFHWTCLGLYTIFKFFDCLNLLKIKDKT